MRPEALEAIVEMVRTRAQARLDLPELRVDPPAPMIFDVEAGGLIRQVLEDDEAIGQSGEGQARTASRIGVVPVRGSIKQHAGGSFWDFIMGGTSCDFVQAAVRMFLADRDVGAVLLDIDSPGGSSYGVFELADWIRQAGAAADKPIVGIANSVAASAAYAILAACDASYCTPGGLVGSVGVYFMHQDLSKMAEEAGVSVTFIQAGKNKTRGNQFEPLSEEDLAYFQGLVDETYRLFLDSVAKGRGTTVADVRRHYGEGDVLIPEAALAAGMVDGILTFDDAVRQASRVKPRASNGRGARRRVEGAIPGRQAGDVDDELEPDPTEDDEDVADVEARRQAFRLTQFRAQQDLAAANGAAISGG